MNHFLARRTDLDMELESRVDTVLLPHQGEVLRVDLDAEMNEALPRGAGENVHRHRARHVVEHVLRFHHPPGAPRGVDVARVESPVRRLVNVRQDLTRIQGPGLEPRRERVSALIGSHRHRGVGQLRGDLLQAGIGLSEVFGE